MQGLLLAVGARHSRRAEVRFGERQAFFSRYRNMNRAAIPSLFFPAMFHTDSIITVAGLPRMSFKARLLNVAAYFAIVRLLGPRSVGAVYKKYQQDGKGSHDDLLSLCCEGGHYFVGIWRPQTFQATATIPD